jgi:DUF1680 family protein
MRTSLNAKLSLWMLIAILGSALGLPAQNKIGAKHEIQPVARPLVVPFAPGDVRLLPGPFRHAMEMDSSYLLSLEPDRFLSWFRKDAGLKPKAPVYGGWESEGLAGHSLGHYLSACSRMYRDTGDREFLKRVNYIVDQLDECQKANGNGYVAAIPGGKELFAKVSRGEIESAGFNLNGGWSPWYTIHKLFAGLRDSYLYCGNEKAKRVMVRLADWVYETTKNLDEAQWQKMLICEYGGMNELMADVYAITGNNRYLTLAEKFYDHRVLDPLAEGHDDLPGLHANTQFPKIIGAERINELTGDAKYDSIARFFWKTVVYHHSYVTGGNSDGEYFGPPDTLNDYLNSNTTESCNTYNMLKLTRHLFQHYPLAKYADYYERAVWNHILASQNPADGMVCYYLSLQQGGHKKFMTPFNDFACCTGTGMENHARYNDNIYFHNDSTLYVNLFIASELNWALKGLRLRQETEFPKTGIVKFVISCDKPERFAMMIRHPFWATKGFTVKINGMEVNAASKPQSYLQLDREWKNGDVVELDMQLFLRTESMPDNPNRVAVFYGPILLAGNLGPIDSDSRIPVFVTDGKPVDEWVTQPRKDELVFRTHGVGRPNDVELVPFYHVHDIRYSVYWDLYDEQGWQAEDSAYRADRDFEKNLEARTIDFVKIGDAQSESEHKLAGDTTGVGSFNERMWRQTSDSGWFSYVLRIRPDTANDLVATYWGGERWERVFDILVDGVKVATQTLKMNEPGKFFHVSYALPVALCKGKSEINVRFQPHPGGTAGGVFGLRTTMVADAKLK